MKTYRGILCAHTLSIIEDNLLTAYIFLLYAVTLISKI